MIYADQGSSLWMRVAQVLFGLLLLVWAGHKTVLMLGRQGTAGPYDATPGPYDDGGSGWKR
ncbi:hypothetical protein ACFQYP_60985 [Nonomuraea antimicrobica]